MNDETKKQLSSFTGRLQEVTEAKAKAATGWQKVLWIAACVACAVAGYFLSGCTTSYTQSAEGDITFSTTIVQPEPYRK